MTPAIRPPMLAHRRRPAAFTCPIARSALKPRSRGTVQRPRKAPPGRWKGALLGALLLGVPILVTSSPVEAGPRNACLDAVRQAEAKYDLPNGLLVSIALAESGLHAHALNIGGRAYYPESPDRARALLSSARAGQSVMAGCVQVNARVHARNSDWPLNPERSADWAARYLRQHYNNSGDWVTALARWNGDGDNRANGLVCRVRAKLDVVEPGSTVLDGARCGRVATARLKRDARALLELAEAPD